MQLEIALCDKWELLEVKGSALNLAQLFILSAKVDLIFWLRVTTVSLTTLRFELSWHSEKDDYAKFLAEYTTKFN